MAHNEAMNSEAMNSSETQSRGWAVRRAVMLGILSSGLLSALIPAAHADKLSCLLPQKLSESSVTQPANKKIGVSVAYLKVPFYANFKTGLEDGAKQFGFSLRPRRRQQRRRPNPDSPIFENFIAQKKDLRPSHALRRRNHPRHQADREQYSNSPH